MVKSVILLTEERISALDGELKITKLSHVVTRHELIRDCVSLGNDVIMLIPGNHYDDRITAYISMRNMKRRLLTILEAVSSSRLGFTSEFISLAHLRSMFCSDLIILDLDIFQHLKIE